MSHVGKMVKGKTYSTAYYMDADIESGMEVRDALGNEHGNRSMMGTLFVGIGHRSNYHNRRRRDYVPPLSKNGKVVKGKNPMYRQGDKFYAFLTKELIPLIEKQYATNGRRTLIGHSFGGLVTFWAMLKEDRPFKNYIALSPSFWKNWGNIFEYESAYHARHKRVDAYLYMSCGSREILNMVRMTNRRMKRVLDGPRYDGLKYEYFEHKGKTHHTQVPVSLEYVMRTVQF